MSDPPRSALQAPLWAIDDTWLEVQCCSGTTFLPLRLLARQHGAERLLGDIVVRLRCKQCGRPPASVALTEDAHGGAPGHGAAPGWRIPLAP
jgi:hypothetical protein